MQNMSFENAPEVVIPLHSSQVSMRLTLHMLVKDACKDASIRYCLSCKIFIISCHGKGLWVRGEVYTLLRHQIQSR